MLVTLALACLVTTTFATVLDQDYCENEESYCEIEIYKVPNHHCKCSEHQIGSIRYREGKLEVCNGKEYEYVCGGCGQQEPLGSENNPAPSCKAILDGNRAAKSGVYFLKVNNIVMKTYCYMNKICGSRAWAMVMKIDGNKKTFRYESSMWSTKQTYNTAAVAGGLDNKETKLDTYSHLPFTKLCLGMKSENILQWGTIYYAASSLYSVIADGKFRHLDQGRNFWKNLIRHSCLQRHCNREGFNVAFKDKTMARIGIISNQENNCKTPDSRIGFGTQGNHCGQKNDNSCGNEARCSADNGDKSIVSFGYIFAQQRRNDAALGSYDNPAKSCEQILDDKSNAKNGVYYLDLRADTITRVYCHMGKICGSRGWTIIMKIDGSKETFSYEKNYWTHHHAYNLPGVNSGPFNGEMKLETYSYFPFKRLCLGMRTKKTNWLKIEKEASSLYSIIAGNHYHATHLGKSKWMDLVEGSSLQPHCNREGFNVDPLPKKTSGTRARIGMVSNQENNCKSPDSRLGFGTSGTYCGQKKSSAGNEARCNYGNNKSIPGHGVIFAQ